MIWFRCAVAAAGVALIGYGAVLLLENPWSTLLRIAVWALAGVLLHDLVFSPLITALGFAGRRILPQSWWAPVGLAALLSVTLLLLAVPVFDKPGERPTNPTVLDRDYPLGLWISLAVVWGCALLYLLVMRLLPARQDQMVEHQRTDHVDRQPPTV